MHERPVRITVPGIASKSRESWNFGENIGDEVDGRSIDRRNPAVNSENRCRWNGSEIPRIRALRGRGIQKQVFV